jgi:hypothetical protein
MTAAGCCLQLDARWGRDSCGGGGTVTTSYSRNPAAQNEARTGHSSNASSHHSSHIRLSLPKPKVADRASHQQHQSNPHQAQAPTNISSGAAAHHGHRYYPHHQTPRSNQQQHTHSRTDLPRCPFAGSAGEFGSSRNSHQPQLQLQRADTFWPHRSQHRQGATGASAARNAITPTSIIIISSRHLDLPPVQDSTVQLPRCSNWEPRSKKWLLSRVRQPDIIAELCEEAETRPPEDPFHQMIVAAVEVLVGLSGSEGDHRYYLRWQQRQQEQHRQQQLLDQGPVEQRGCDEHAWGRVVGLGGCDDQAHHHWCRQQARLAPRQLMLDLESAADHQHMELDGFGSECEQEQQQLGRGQEADAQQLSLGAIACRELMQLEYGSIYEQQKEQQQWGQEQEPDTQLFDLAATARRLARGAARGMRVRKQQQQGVQGQEPDGQLLDSMEAAADCVFRELDGYGSEQEQQQCLSLSWAASAGSLGDLEPPTADAVAHALISGSSRSCDKSCSAGSSSSQARGAAGPSKVSKVFCQLLFAVAAAASAGAVSWWHAQG